jgi:type III secretory pathway component EscU
MGSVAVCSIPYSRNVESILHIYVNALSMYIVIQILHLPIQFFGAMSSVKMSKQLITQEPDLKKKLCYIQYMPRHNT